MSGVAAQRVLPNAESDSAQRRLAMLRRSHIIECSRCGNQELERRTGWFRDADYYELLREYLWLEAELKDLRRQFLREQWAHSNTRDLLKMADNLQEHTWPLALAQLRVMIAMHPDEPQ